MAKKTTNTAASAIALSMGAQTLTLASIPEGEREKIGLQVTASPEKGFWRAGRHFTRETVVIALSELSDEEIAAITSEPMLASSLVPIAAAEGSTSPA